MENNSEKTKICADNAATSAAIPELDGGILSVIMPVYNLESEIFDNISVVRKVFLNRLNFEIIPVDDGSCDHTAAELRRAELTFPDIVKPVFLKNNSGKGAAFASGFYRSRGSCVLLLDGDLDLDPEFVWGFFDVMHATGADIVIGSKMHPKSKVDYPLRRRFASFIYYSLVKLLLGLPVHDTQTGMKLFRRETLAYAFERILAKSFAFDLELLAVAHGNGYRVEEAPIRLDFGVKLGCLSFENVKNVLTDTFAIFYREKLLNYYRHLESHNLPGILPKVSVVVACPGRTDCIDDCVRGIMAQDWQNIEVILLPDSDFAKPDWYPLYVRVVPTGKIRPAEKRNLGVSASSGSIIAFVDDDVVPQHGWLAHAVQYFDDSSVCGVGGPAVTPHEEGFAARAGGRVFENILVSGAAYRRYKPTRVHNDDDMPSCNLILRRTAFDKAGGFNVNYWPGEDTMLCMKLTSELGMRLVYDPRVCVSHRRRPLFGPHLRQVARYARHRGFFAAQGYSTSCRFMYFVPTIFVVSLALGFPICVFSHVFRMFYVSGLAAYAFLTFASSMLFSGGTLIFRLFVWLGIILTHVVYGINFARGFFSKGMETRVREFDHVGQNGGSSCTTVSGKDGTL